ncbi:phragmoplastin interacting protein 1 [Cornus florida]|uniref:phragmoplastin interacting protein 1 n=1 Tax=Cornus florida TaxID=4283 RepID=UPI0028A25E6B|nr:phragmoplastin interacting protein 1 [Cornus florida]XP_059628183.1 phragmoplastin interacting protein 1 [Cornus florida]
MVLSNKKLKQKLRDVMVDSLAASEAQTHRTNVVSTDTDDPKSQTPNSLKSLLDSATQKPRLSKREKRRKPLPLQGTEVVGVSESGDTEEKGNEKSGSYGASKRKKRKREEATEVVGVSESGDTEEKENEKSGLDSMSKRKKRSRKEGLESGLAAKSEQSVAAAKKAMKSKKRKKQKKKKRKEKKLAKEEAKKVAMEEAKKGDEGASGGIEEQGGDERIQNNHSQENEDAVTKVYVGGIPYYSTEDDIRSFFDGCGTITEVDCMRFPDSGKFRGIAIINFKTEAAAKRALALDGADMGGLFLKIQPYESTRIKSTRVSKVSDFAPAIVEGYNRIYIGNLSWDITEDELRKFFSGCSISSIKFGEDKETGEFRGYAHVDFADSLSLNMALKLDQKIVFGRPVRISCAVPRKVPESNSKSAPTSNVADSGEASTLTGKIRRRTCYECGEKGHLSSSCPKKQTTDLTYSS